METRLVRWPEMPWPAAASATLASLRAFGWMAGGFGLAVVALVVYEQVSSPERPVPWEALGWLLLAGGTAGIVASLAGVGAEGWRHRLFALGAGLLVSPGLLLGDPPVWMAVPGVAVPLLALLLRQRPDVHVASLALLALGFLSLQSAMPWLGGERGLLYLVGAAVAAITFVALPRQKEWLPVFALAAALPLFVTAA